jgi:hypothetical protein
MSHFLNTLEGWKYIFPNQNIVETRAWNEIKEHKNLQTSSQTMETLRSIFVTSIADTQRLDAELSLLSFTESPPITSFN